ncbi:MAG: response regulator, partial [Deltaproteobacteria bacterium]|nr:response regulator [Deltaproteobacteria bacterium]
EDVTQRKAAESEKKAMEEQVRQAQKMDSIGRLAGGIAHDFNNLLTVIQGRNQMVLSELPKGDPLRLDLEEVAEASLKAESLIGHLLTFSRQKIIKPQVLGLNEVIGQAGRMIQRLIGENLELSTFLTPDLEQIKMDQTQLEQVLVNLAVNSRDAMPGGGKLVIETSMADLDEDDWPFFPELSADCSYLLLTVSDNGHGIPPEIIGNIFEPFFSTKEPGKGTGLGLSTVYGIVKQSGGIIRVDSELGRGTTFKIFLPVFVDRTHQVESSVAVPEAPREINPHRYDSSTHETVLVVEDEEAVGNLVQRILETHGYTTLRAKNGKEAITLSHQTDRHIDLLLTDMVMPMMSGKELAFKMAGERPDMKIMFMSGYTDPSIVGLDGLKEDAVFMQKPFTSDLLLSRMREVLGPKGEEPAGVKKILVIDDDEAIRGLIKRYLDGRGFELFEASNGVEGLAMADSIPFDMVISDIVMPEKEGLETCMELRRKFPGIKIVAMSGANAGKDYLTMAGKLAADKILSKPFDQRILLDIIDSNLKKSPYPPS